MLVRTQNQLLHTNLENLKNFSVKISPKFFDIMSAQLYSNPKKAVIRELANNAFDAVKAVGKPVSSIRISAPTAINPFFVVEDCGPGLSPEEIELYYTCYFSSSKDHTDDFIGGFGLGCKSPFALTDNFTVISCNGGMRRTYFLFRKDGIPAISLVAEEPCGDHTGLTVKVPIPSNQFTEFNDILRDFFLWWPELPTFNNIDVRSLVRKEHFLPIDNFHIYAVDTAKLFSPDWPNGSNNSSSSYHNFRVNIFVGNALYRIDANHKKYALIADAVLNVYKNIIIYANTSDIELTPSREQLYYSSTTLNFIHSALSKILDNLKNHCLDLFAAGTNLNANFHNFVKSCVSPVATIKSPQHFQSTFKFFADAVFYLQSCGVDLHSIKSSGVIAKEEIYTVPHFIQTYNKTKGLYEKGLAFSRPTLRSYQYSGNNLNRVYLELKPKDTIFFSPTELVLSKVLFERSKEVWENCYFNENKNIKILIIELTKVTNKDIRTLRRYIEHQDNENLTLIITDNPQKYLDKHSTIRLATDADIQRMLECAPPIPEKTTSRSQNLTLIQLLQKHAFIYNQDSSSLSPYRLSHPTNFWVPFYFSSPRDYREFEVESPLYSWLVKNSPDIRDIAFVPKRYANRASLKQMTLYTPNHIAQNTSYLEKLFNTFIITNNNENLFPITCNKLNGVLQILKYIRKTGSPTISHPDFRFMWDTLHNTIYPTNINGTIAAYELFHVTPTWTNLTKKALDIFGSFISYLQTDPGFVYMILGIQNPIVDTSAILGIIKDKADTFFTS